jgi:predicted PurR-regulated permease PerM
MIGITYTKIVYWTLFVVLLIASLIVVKPFIYVTLAGMVIAYIFYPIYRRILKKIKREWVAALITSILLILLVTAIIILVVDLFVNEAYVTYILLKQKVATITASQIVCEDSGIKCSVLNYYSKTIGNPRVSIYMNNALAKGAEYLINLATNFIVSIPRLLLDLFILLFVMYYTFKDGDKLVKKIWLILPLKKDHQAKIGKRVSDIINSTIYGAIVVSAIQGVVALIGYYFFGLSSPIILGILTALSAIVPGIGSALVWLPASLILIADGISSGSNTVVFNGIGLMVYGLVLISTIDNFVKPKLIGNRAQLHPAFVLLGILGGLMMFGLIGVILGPLILALFVTFVEIYEETEFD